MRAQTVDFERGLDPRKILGGIAEYIKNFDNNYFKIRSSDQEGGRKEAKDKLLDIFLKSNIKEIKPRTIHKKIWGTIRDEGFRSFQLDHGIILTTDADFYGGDLVIFKDDRKYDLGSSSDTSTFKEVVKALINKIENDKSITL